MSFPNSLPTATRNKVSLYRGFSIPYIHPAAWRSYATANSLAEASRNRSRKQVTVTNDDGRVPWKDLTMGEAVARTTQQTFNFGVVMAGVVGTVCFAV